MRSADRTSLESPPRLLANRVALGFGAVAVVSVAMCVLLLWIIYDVSGLVASMRHDETSIRQGRQLATAVREMSLHIAHTVIEADDSHLARYAHSRKQVRAHLANLRTRVPEEERFRLRELEDQTHRMHAVLTSAALPAARRGDRDVARQAHRQLEALGKQAAQHADALARATASQMVHAHVLATHATRLGILGGGLCVAVVLALSIGFTLRLRAAVLKPLHALTEAAGRIGRGDFDLRLGKVGEGELAALAEAFDHMADELARREARLLRSQRMAVIGQLAAGVAHELNNPIGIIRGYLKTMDPEGNPQDMREELAILDEEAHHCQRIAEDLLSYARADQLTLDRLHIGPFLEETVERFREGAVGGSRVIEVSVEDQEMDVDAPRIRQVLLNLLTNAVEASPEASPVALAASVDAACYRIEVRDRGPGVAAEDRERIFDPFFSRRRGGTGLGLSVCLGIVKAHGGTIDVDGSSEGGAVFRVRLPLVPPRAHVRDAEALG